MTAGHYKVPDRLNIWNDTSWWTYIHEFIFKRRYLIYSLTFLFNFIIVNHYFWALFLRFPLSVLFLPICKWFALNRRFLILYSLRRPSKRAEFVINEDNNQHLLSASLISSLLHQCMVFSLIWIFILLLI